MEVIVGLTSDLRAFVFTSKYSNKFSLNSYAFSDRRRIQTLNKCTGPLGWISTIAIFSHTIMLNDEASKTLYISFLQLFFDFFDVAWVKAHKGVAKSSEPKIHEGVLVFLFAQIIWYWGVLVLYKKKGFARSWHWKNEKPGPTKAWTQYWQNNFSSRRGDHNTIHPLSVLKAPRPYILKKLWWVSIFNS